MKLTISSTNLLKALMDVSKAIPSKSPLPILENFLFVLKEGVLEITASDSELTLRTRIEAEGSEEDGSIAVPARHMIDLLKELPDLPLSIKTVSDSSFECSWGSGNSALPYFPAADYPEIKSTGDDAITVEFPAESLVEGIQSTVYATADDEIRPAMNGIFFDMDVNSTTLVASDSHKLICYTTKDVKAPEKASFILHKKPASVLRSIIGKDPEKASFILHKKPASVLRSIIGKDVENVSISFDSSSAQFSFGATTLICRLVVGKYPKYRDVIPLNNSNVLQIDRQLLLNTVKRVAVCANKASNHIKLTLKEGQLEVSAQDLGFALAAYEKIMCNYSGDELTIGFKSTFLTEILANMNCNSLVVKFADARRAALILPAEEEAETEKVCGILMPIMIQ